MPQQQGFCYLLVKIKLKDPLGGFEPSKGSDFYFVCLWSNAIMLLNVYFLSGNSCKYFLW